MSTIGQRERATQQRLIQFFVKDLGYRYLGRSAGYAGDSNIDTDILSAWLKRRGVSDTLITRVLRQLDSAASLGEGKKLYYANKEVYRLLRYGVKEKEGVGEQNQTVWLIDWAHPEANDFAIADEVTVKGEYSKRPDLVLYVNYDRVIKGLVKLKTDGILNKVYMALCHRAFAALYPSKITNVVNVSNFFSSYNYCNNHFQLGLSEGQEWFARNLDLKKALHRALGDDVDPIELNMSLWHLYTQVIQKKNDIGLIGSETAL